MKHFWENEYTMEKQIALFNIMEKLCIAYKFFSEHHDGMFSDFYRYTCNIEKIFDNFEYIPNHNNDKTHKAQELIDNSIENCEEENLAFDYWDFLCMKYGFLKDKVLNPYTCEYWEHFKKHCPNENCEDCNDIELENIKVIVSKVYNVISPESAENGDFEESGFEFENVEYSLYDLKCLIDNEGFSREGNTGWLQTVDPDRNYENGNETYYSLHFENDDQFENVCRLLNL